MTNLEDFERRYQQARFSLSELLALFQRNLISALEQSEYPDIINGIADTMAFLVECAESKKKELQGKEAFAKFKDRLDARTGFMQQIVIDTLTKEEGESEKSSSPTP